MFDELVIDNPVGYFNENESYDHMIAKDKLFRLITNKRVKIFDEEGKRYDVFTGERDDEFLHQESFVVDYGDDVLFSSPNSPCKTLPNFKPMCDQKGYYGAYENLPCKKCMLANVGDLHKSSRFGSYRPDISFGYGGKHVIWLEVSHTNPCSFNKINFCMNHNITLLEIDSSVIDDFKDFSGELVFKKLEYEPVKLDEDELGADLDEFIKLKIHEKGYMGATDLKQKLALEGHHYAHNINQRYDIWATLTKT